MGAALSILVLLSVSVFVVRLASVALRLTGLPEGVARFQALSAFTGTGYTTVTKVTRNSNGCIGPPHLNPLPDGRG